ncbi:MAG: hypothetical protein IJ679_08545, partial [Lachnospiraceae bacterium]|nr:hypothetical protein [Lachnospiraceae bacterium]
EADSDEADALNEDAEEAEEVEATEEVAEDEADTLNDSALVGPVVDVVGSADTHELFGFQAKDLGAPTIDHKTNEIKGSLKYIALGTEGSGSAYSKGLAAGGLLYDWGAGYFLAVKVADMDNWTDSVRMGIRPNLRDRDLAVLDDGYGVFKITNKYEEKLVVEYKTVASDWRAENVHRDVYDLSGLTLSAPTIGESGDVRISVAKTDSTTGLIGNASELQSGITITNSATAAKKISGTLHYLTGTTYTDDVTGSGDDTSENSGYYLAVDITESDEDIGYIGAGLSAGTGTKWSSTDTEDNTVVLTKNVGDGNTFVFRIADKWNTSLHVVGFAAEPTNKAGVVSGQTYGSAGNPYTNANILYDEYFDLSGLTLSSSATISEATVGSVQRSPSENSLIRTGDKVHFLVSGTITGASSGNVPTLSITGGWGSSKAESSSVSDFKVSGSKWQAKVETTAPTDAGTAVFKVATATFTKGETTVNATGVPESSEELTINSAALAGTVAFDSTWKTSGSETYDGSNKEDWDPSEAVYENSKLFRVGNSENSDVYIAAKYTGNADSNVNVVAYKWTWTNPNSSTSASYYTYAGSASNFLSKLTVPTIPTAGFVAVSVEAMGYHATEVSSLLQTSVSSPETSTTEIQKDYRYQKNKIADFVDNKAVFQVGKTWTTAKSSGLWARNYKILKKITPADKLVDNLDVNDEYPIYVGDSDTWYGTGNDGGTACVSVAPTDAADSVTFTINSSNKDAVSATIVNADTGKATIKGLAVGKSTITWTATQEDGTNASCSVTVNVKKNDFALAWAGTYGSTVYTHEGVGTLNLDDVFVKPTSGYNGTNVLNISMTGSGTENFTSSEVQAFGYAYDYPEGSGAAAARKLYEIDGSKLKISGSGEADVEMAITCKKGTTEYGVVKTTMHLVVEAAVPSSLVFNPESYTVQKADETPRTVSADIGSADPETVTFAWTVPTADDDYVKKGGDENSATISVYLASTAAAHYLSDTTTVAIKVTATQTFKDGYTPEVPSKGTFPVYITKNAVTLEGAKITESTKTKGVVEKANTTSTSTYKDVIVSTNGTRTFTASALPGGFGVSDWTWEASKNNIVNIETSGSYHETASISGIGAGEVDITAVPDNSSTVAAKFHVVVYAAPGKPAVTLTSTKGTMATENGYYVLEDGNSYEVGYTVGRSGTTDVPGYKLEVITKNVSQTGTDGKAFEPITISSNVKETGKGTITASKFTNDAVVLNYSFVLTNENDEEEDPISGDDVKLVVDNVALSATDPITFTPNSISVAPGADLAITTALNPEKASGVEYAWQIVDYKAAHYDSKWDPATAENDAVETYAKIVGSKTESGVTVRGIKDSTQDFDLKLTYTQKQLDTANIGTPKEVKKTEFAPITVAYGGEVTGMNLYVDGEKSDNKETWYLANDSSEKMEVASAVLPTNIEEKRVKWTLENTSYATIKEAEDGTSYTGESVTIIPKDGVTGVVALNAEALGSRASLVRSIYIYVKAVTLEDVRFAVESNGKYEIITEDYVQVRKDINVVALPYPRTAKFDASKTVWTAYSAKTGTTLGDYVKVTGSGTNGTITGNVIGGPDYVEATLYSGDKAVACSERLAITVTENAAPFSEITLDNGSGELKVGQNMNITVKFRPSGADPKSLVWSTLEGNKVYDAGSTDVKYAKLVVDSTNTSATITGLAEGVSTIRVTGKDKTGEYMKHATCVVTVTEDKPDGVVVSTITAEGDTTDLKKTDGDEVFAIVPASKSVTIAATAMKSGEAATNPNVRWFDEKGTELTAGTTGATSVKIDGAAAGSVIKLTGQTVVNKLERVVTLYVAPKLDTANTLLKVNDGKDIESVVYTGSRIEPAVNVTFKNYTLSAGTDYAVEYPTDSTNSGEKSLKINVGTGNLFSAADAGNELTKKYTISQADLSDAVVALKSLIYTGSEQTPEVESASINGVALDKNDLLLVEGRATAAGEHTATFQAKAGSNTAINFKGTTKAISYTIAPATISGVKLSKDSFTYNGSKQVPTVDGGSLKEGTDFKATIPAASTNANKYTVTVTGIGNYTGTLSLPYEIKAATLTNKLVSLSKTSFTYNG